jgi:hypothetical protein
VFEVLTNGKDKWFEIKAKLKVYPNVGQTINYGNYLTNFLMFLFGIKANYGVASMESTLWILIVFLHARLYLVEFLFGNK